MPDLTTTVSLDGKSYEYTYIDSGMHAHVVFDHERANWEILGGANKGETGSNDYKARSVSEGVFYIMWHEPLHGITVVLLINEGERYAYGTVVSPAGIEFDVAEFASN